MSSIFKWMTGTVSAASNSAAGAILKSIIKRFIEEPIDEKMLEIQLFEDWRMHLQIQKVFVNTAMANQFLAFISFRSIYIAKFSFDASYNLSSFSAAGERIVIEFDAHQPQELPSPDPDLTESIHNFQEQLPEEAKGGPKNWIMNAVKRIDVNLSKITVIAHIGPNFDPVSLIIDKMTFNLNKDTVFTAKAELPKLSLLLGLKKKQRDVLLLNELSASFTDNTLSIVLDSISINVEQMTPAIISELLNMIPSSTAKPSQQSSDLSIIIKFQLNHVKLTTSIGHLISIEKINFEFCKDYFSISVGSLSFHYNNNLVFSLSSPTSINGTFPIDKQLHNFYDFPCQLHDSLKYQPTGQATTSILVTLPIITVIISNELIDSLLSLVGWFSVFHFESQKAVSTTASSMQLHAQLPELALKYASLDLKVKNLETSLFSYSERSDLNLGLTLSIGDIILSNSDFHILQFPSQPALNLAFKSTQKLGEDLTRNISIRLNNPLIRVPLDFSIFSPIIDMLNKFTPQKSTPSDDDPIRQQITIDADFSATIDYILKNMPARFLLSVSAAKAKATVKTVPLTVSSEIDLSAKVLLSNTRDDLPLVAFTLSDFPTSHFNFVQIIGADIQKVTVSLADGFTKVNVEKCDATATFCFDSLKLLLSSINHILYKLDLPPEKRPPLHKFELPQELPLFRSKMEESLLTTTASMVDFSKSEVIDEIPTDGIESEEKVTFDEFEDTDTPIYQPKSSPQITIQFNANVNVSIFGGRDFQPLYDLQPLSRTPLIVDGSGIDDCFEILPTREEWQCISINLRGNGEVSCFDDPFLAVRVSAALDKFEVIDQLPQSASRLIFGIDEQKALNLGVDLLNNKQRTELSIRIELPKMAGFVTQEAVDFLIGLVNTSMPSFPADSIIDEALAFQSFVLKPSSIRLFAHFRLWLDVHIDDVVLHPPPCALFACRGGDGLAGALGDFYINEMLRPGAVAVAAGLPVLKSVRHIGVAVRDLFTFDAQRFGVWKGLSKSFATLLQVVASEALNVGVTATTVADRILGIVTGGGDPMDGKQKSVATLVMTGGDIPQLKLSKGVLSVGKLTDLLKKMRNKVNPSFQKYAKYAK